MAKKQKSFFEKLTEINASHDESKKEKKIKKARFSNKKIWISLGILGAIVVSSISIPLIINTTVVNLVPARAADASIISFKDPSGKNVNISVGDVTKQISDEQQSNAVKLTDAYKKAIFYLYDKEQKASVTFQRIWNLSRSVGEAERTDLALKSIEDVKKAQQAKINDLKRNLQNSFGFKNWEAEFQKEIAKDTYGKSITEAGAVDFLTFKELEKDALRRFQLENSSQSLFTNAAQINRTATSDIYELDDEGNRKLDAQGKPIVLFRQGQKVFPEFKENVNFFSSGTSDKIYTLKTRSFQTDKWDAGIFIDQYLKDNTPYIISNFTIPGTAPATLTSPWTVNKKQFTNFALYSVLDDKVYQNGALIPNFKNLEQYVLDTSEAASKQKALYENYLNALSIDPDNIKNNLGSTGVVSLVSLFNQENQTPVAMSLLTSLFETDSSKLPSVDLSNLFTINFDANTKKSVDDLLTQAKAIQDGQDIKSTNVATKNEAINKMSNLISQVNIIIQRYLSQLSDANFNDLVGNVYRQIFVKTVANKDYVSFAYNVAGSPDTKAVLTSAGITLVKFNKVDSKDDFLKLIKSDLLNLSNGKPQYFKALNAINVDTQNQNVVLSTLLKEPDFDNYLKQEVNVHSKNKTDKYTDADITDLSNIATSILTGTRTNQAYSGLQKVDAWLKTTINSHASYNFTLKDGVFYIDYNKAVPNSLSTLSAKDTILNRIFADFKLVKPGGTN